MRSWRVLASELAINEIPVTADYADVFVVLREGDEQPGPNDWEATVRTAERQHFPPGTYELQMRTPDDVSLSGHAILRFSDGHHHHFRGDGELGGVRGITA
ncbi:MAG: hypothetical protein ACSLFP_15045 [Acidimicrobiales bacterium]